MPSWSCKSPTADRNWPYSQAVGNGGASGKSFSLCGGWVVHDYGNDVGATC